MALRNGSRFGGEHGAMCSRMAAAWCRARSPRRRTTTSRPGRRSPAVDKLTGKRVFQCRVSDMDPELAGRSREVVVKILADRMPAPPTGQPFELVEFEGLQVTPWTRRANDRSGRGSRSRCAPPASSPPAPAAHAKDAA